MIYDLSIVIPCYNEEQNIRLGALDKVALYLEKQTFKWEVLIVDDGSSDDSRTLIKKFISGNKNFRMLENPHLGKAGTVKTGMLEAKNDLILFTDLDQATPLDQVEILHPWFDKGYDIVIGSRKDRRAGAPLTRKIMGQGFMLVRNIILGLKIEDTQCGFKMFRRSAARDIFRKLVLYGIQHGVSGPRVTAGFDVEVLFIAQKLDYKIKEVPVEWHYVDTRRVSPIADSLDAFIDILKIRYLSLKKAYK